MSVANEFRQSWNAFMGSNLYADKTNFLVAYRQFVSKLKGSKGSEVQLVIYRKSEKQD
jgi:C-terminal processing protease CtpA/Prc